MEININSLLLTNDELSDLVNEMKYFIEDETDATVNFLKPSDAQLINSSDKNKTKGEPITLGALTITFISSGAMVAFFEIFKTYFAREPSLEIEITKNDGTKIKLNAKNVDDTQIKEAFKFINENQ
ncbi:MAG: hypothetical protein HRT51_09545 [Colwellia sp.]|nr:hypothetical protein [Colwellia sp.]